MASGPLAYIWFLTDNHARQSDVMIWNMFGVNDSLFDFKNNESKE